MSVQNHPVPNRSVVRPATRSPARWNRQQRLFDALVALPEAERAGWLAVPPDDDSLKREALALAETDAQSGDAIAH